MIEFDGVSVTYPDAPGPTLCDVRLHVPEGELCLLAGRTGSGKSTLLKCVNGLVPHFTGGTLTGTVTVDGRDTRLHPPRELADLVGYVGQDPVSGFVTDNVEDELAYSMESLGLANPVMRKRVEETIDLLGLADLRHRPLAQLSGGQQQRVAIGAALTAHPRILVLDEPTSALDPGAAEEVLAALHRLVHDLGVTVLLAEHRLERVVQYADRVVLLPSGLAGTPGEVLAGSEVAPPVVRLGDVLGWESHPVSIRDARRLARGAALPAAGAANSPGPGSAQPLLTVRGAALRYGSTTALAGVDLAVARGERLAVMGRNGAGKSSLLWGIQGTGDLDAGTVTVDGEHPRALRAAHRRRLAGLVPQQPTDLLYLETVAAECAQADLESGARAGTCRAILDRLAPGLRDALHPRDASEGQRLSLVLAIALTASPALLLLDEPTRGLDHPGKAALAALLADLSARGHAVIVTTHDVEFVAEYATRVVVLADGEVVADGPTAEVVTASPVFAPQVSKILPGYLTVEAVARALGEVRP
ncbi:cobalt ABC transporter ATP-binding protein [Longispora fulva]|uniref:Energy-coupling factor transport system ATP-binding protein n=1 Tax=Longispora fulva TaxID=619741 RepID=A0A8J7GJ42_9ACTN|nr:ABC transporter ATP-binding protein [Longispora fulva]MBG6139061.1 energy-coupling factor transport system ATP-binding protein [Longispora fulva]GIG58554.1 cobalt ABC transporter ATP-binding protein [Longispora fulva]